MRLALFAASLFLIPAQLSAQETMPGFREWLTQVETEAVSQGLDSSKVSAALATAEHIDKVIELDRRQPEFTITYAQYIKRVVTDDKVKRARKHFAENRKALLDVSARYGVQPQYIVALWGIETDFGRVTGGYSVVSALATLGYDGRRSAYFKGELLNALKILDQGHISPDRMLGSWAGAMGQCQFMPSSFLRFAEDGDGDGKRDIWSTKMDVFASAANYLSRSGWNASETWGRPVKLPKNFDDGLVGLTVQKKVKDWRRLGVLAINGKALPASDVEGSVIYADKDKRQAFLVYGNFRTVLKWNRSTYFGLAVGILADRIAAH